jgi:hypothetical protein
MSSLENVINLPPPVSAEKEDFGQSIPKALSNAAARLVDALKINSVSERVQRGRRFVIKRRNGYSEPLAELTNVYFRMAGIQIHFWSKTEEWQQWEINCFNTLNGDRFHARASGADSICVDKLPGKSLWSI